MAAESTGDYWTITQNLLHSVPPHEAGPQARPQAVLIFVKRKKRTIFTNLELRGVRLGTKNYNRLSQIECPERCLNNKRFCNLCTVYFVQVICMLLH